MRKFVLSKISRYMVGSYSLNSGTPYKCYLHVSEGASQGAKATNHVSASDQDVTTNTTPSPSPLPSHHLSPQTSADPISSRHSLEEFSLVLAVKDSLLPSLPPSSPSHSTLTQLMADLFHT